MKKILRPKPGRKFFLLLMMFFVVNTPVWTTPSIEDVTAFLPASKEFYSREEVAALIREIWIIAEEEMERTALEAAREAAADEAGETAVTQVFQEQLEDEVELLLEQIYHLSSKLSFYKTFGIVAAGIAVGTISITAIVAN